MMTAKSWPTSYLAPVLCAVAVLIAPVAAQQPPPRVAGAPAAAQTLQQRLGAYLVLRADLARKLEPLTPSLDASELAARQRRLADAIRAARAGARPGDLIPAAASQVIQAVIADDFKRRTAAAERATFSEVPGARLPLINRTYPASAALATVPPLLLMNLPRLPDNLQYRFYGRHLLLLDGDVQIILDYIPNVLPPH